VAAAAAAVFADLEGNQHVHVELPFLPDYLGADPVRLTTATGTEFIFAVRVPLLLLIGI
jgi:hypothetical protein